MIYFFLLFCFISITEKKARSQLPNLIYNPSFEEEADVYKCSCHNLAYFYKGMRTIGWTCSNYGTPDTFSSCRDSSCRAPSSIVGYQHPYHGNVYAGGAFLYQNTLSHGPYTENLQGTLTEPLKPGQGYCFDFMLSVADRNFSDCTVDTLHIYFHGLDTFYTTPCIWPFCFSSFELLGKQQMSIATGPLTDTLNWHKMESAFRAQGGEKFFIVGSFKPGSNIKFKDAPINAHGEGYDLDSIAALFFDDFHLYECDEYGLGDHKIRLPNIFTPNGDGINDSYFIHDYLPPGFLFRVYNRWGKEIYRNDNYQNDWSPNNISDGTYWVVVKNPDSGTEMRQVVTIISSK